MFIQNSKKQPQQKIQIPKLDNSKSFVYSVNQLYPSLDYTFQRASHTSVILPTPFLNCPANSLVFIFGGIEDSMPSSFLLFNLSTNTYSLHPILQDASIQSEVFRFSAASCVDALTETVYIIGGSNCSVQAALANVAPKISMLKFQYSNNYWNIEHYSKLNDQVPPNLMGHSLVQRNRELILFGGLTLHHEQFGQYNNNIYSFNMDLNTWTCIFDAAAAAKSEVKNIANHCAAYSSKHDCMLVYAHTKLQDQNNSVAAAAATMYIYNFLTKSWSTVQASAAVSNELVKKHSSSEKVSICSDLMCSMCIDDEKSLCYVFGGTQIAVQGVSASNLLKVFDINCKTWLRSVDVTNNYSLVQCNDENDVSTVMTRRLSHTVTFANQTRF